MKFFSDCSACAICGAGNGCLAGNGDNDYFPATKEQIIERLDNHEYESYRSQMIGFLKDAYGVEYVEH